MMRRIWLCVLGLLLLAVGSPVGAQEDALNLPTELYVLTNSGVVQRYGVGAVGVASLTPPDAFVLDFGVSPDGNQMLYRTATGSETSLFLADISGATGTQIQTLEGSTASDPPVRGHGDTIVWSPPQPGSASDAVAFTTEYGARVYFINQAVFTDIQNPAQLVSLSWSPGGTYLAAQASNPDPSASGNFWWIYQRSGTALNLTAVVPPSLGTAWVGDTEMVFTPVDGGLMLMRLTAANAQVTLLNANSVYALPYYTSDDRLLFFARQKDDSAVEAGYGTLMSMARGGQQMQTLGQTPVDVNGLQWAPGGTLIIAFQGGVLALFDPASGQGFPLPVGGAVTYSWGPFPPPVRQPVPQPTISFPTGSPPAPEAATIPPPLETQQSP